MRITSVGASALLLECPDDAQVQAWRAELWRRRDTGELIAADIVPGARTVLLDGVPDTAELADAIRSWPPPGPVPPTEGAQVDVPTVFDGADLEAVAAHRGMPVDQVVDRLCTADLRVAFCGFAPGFAYLSGLPPEWDIPRLAAPRPRVPAGSVGLAGGYVGIYPTASPGGWRLVGRTDVPLFDVTRDPPALLTPGTPVRLVRR